MKIQKIWAVFFSPTGGTEAIVTYLAKELGRCFCVPVEKRNITLPEERNNVYSFSEEDLLILGVPVYAGRIPNKILPDLDHILEGKKTWVIPVSVFGNRNYDDALMEMTLLLQAHGFQILAAAAVANRHAFSPHQVGAGRPDVRDWEKLKNFVCCIVQKMKENVQTEVKVKGRNPVGAYYTPLKEDGTPAKFLKAKPITEKKRCTQCGICAMVCPMGSIDQKEYTLVNGVCIKCQACIRKCPHQAKYFEDEDFLSHVKMLEKNYQRRAENDFFV